eukprot:6534038-Alexandrium_andersonii.AAC.2
MDQPSREGIRWQGRARGEPPADSQWIARSGEQPELAPVGVSPDWRAHAELSAATDGDATRRSSLPAPCVPTERKLMGKLVR